MNDDSMEWACLLCGFRTPETPKLQCWTATFTTHTRMGWEMAELILAPGDCSQRHKQGITTTRTRPCFTAVHTGLGPQTGMTLG